MTGTSMQALKGGTDREPLAKTSIWCSEQQNIYTLTSDSWAIKSQFRANTPGLSSLPPAASQRTHARGELHGDSSSCVYRKRLDGRMVLSLAALASVVAILFLVSRCAAVSTKWLPNRLGRRLVVDQETQESSEGSHVLQDLCGGGGSQLVTAAPRHRRSTKSLDADLLEAWGEAEGEPPQKKRKGNLGGQLQTQSSHSHAVEGIGKSGETADTADVLRHSILLYVEQTLAEKHHGLDEEEWLRDPFGEMQFLDEEQPTQSFPSVESAAPGQQSFPTIGWATAGPQTFSTVEASAVGSQSFPTVASALTGPQSFDAGESAAVGQQSFPTVASPAPGPQSVPTVGCGAAGPQSLPTVESAAPAPLDGSPTLGRTALARPFPEEGTAGSASRGDGKQKYINASSSLEVESSGAQPSPQGALLLQPRAHSPAVQDTSKTVLCQFIVGKPGIKGSYMLLGSEVSDFQGRPALAIVSVPLPGPSNSKRSSRPVDIGQHPFYRIPRVAPGAWVRDITFKGCRLHRRRTLVEGRALLGFKELLKKPLLNPLDLECLMQHLELLVNHTIPLMKPSIDGLKPKYVVEKLAYALLVTDAMYAASEVLGTPAKRSEWWPKIIATLPVYSGPNASDPPRATAQQNILLAQLLQSALEFYKSGSRPPAAALVPLKQILLCTPAVPALRRGPWVHFMADDLEWQKSQ